MQVLFTQCTIDVVIAAFDPKPLVVTDFGGYAGKSNKGVVRAPNAGFVKNRLLDPFPNPLSRKHLRPFLEPGRGLSA